MRSPAGSNRPRRGVTLPFVVLLIATFIGMAAFAIDFSRMYIIHGQLQTASEAGALAGTNAIIHGDGDNAADSAVLFAQRNPTDSGVAPDVGLADVVFGRWAAGTFTPTASWNDPQTNAVSVTTRHTGRYFFGPIYGLASRALNATAIAEIGSVSKAHCIRPIAIPYSAVLSTLYPTNTPPVTYNLTEQDIANLALMTQANAMTMKTNDPNTTVVSGNFYAIDEGPSYYADGTLGNPITHGASSYRAGLAATKCADLEYQGQIGIGDYVQVEKGNVNGPTSDGLWTRCGGTGNSPANFTCPTPVPFLVPIWDFDDKSKGSPTGLHVKYLGVYYAVGFSKNDGIIGYFSTMSAQGEFTEEPGPLPRAVLRR